MKKKGNLVICCVDCRQQKKYWARNLCRMCWTRGRAEKQLATHPKIRTAGQEQHQQWLQRLAEYNELRQAGYLQTEIADMTGWGLSTVKNMTGRAKKAGLYVFLGSNAKRKNADTATPS